MIERRLAIPWEDRVLWSKPGSQLASYTSSILSVQHYSDSVGPSGEYDPRAVAQLLHSQHVGLALPVVIERRGSARFPRVASGGTPDARVCGAFRCACGWRGRSTWTSCWCRWLATINRHFGLVTVGSTAIGPWLRCGSRPFTIGVGFAQALLVATIHPQPHDIPMDMIITN